MLNKLRTEVDVSALRQAKAAWLAERRKQASVHEEPAPGASDTGLQPPMQMPRQQQPTEDAVPWEQLEAINRYWVTIPDRWLMLLQRLQAMHRRGEAPDETSRWQMMTTAELTRQVLIYTFGETLTDLYYQHYE